MCSWFIDYSVIEPTKPEEYIAHKMIRLLSKIIAKARKTWSEYSSTVKFVVDKD